MNPKNTISAPALAVFFKTSTHTAGERRTCVAFINPMKSILLISLLSCLLPVSNVLASGSGFEFSVDGAEIKKTANSVEGKLPITNYKITVKGTSGFKIIATAMYYTRGGKTPGKAEQAVFHGDPENFKGFKQRLKGQSDTIVEISKVVKFNTKIRFKGKVLGRDKTVDFLIVHPKPARL